MNQDSKNFFAVYISSKNGVTNLNLLKKILNKSLHLSNQLISEWKINELQKKVKDSKSRLELYQYNASPKVTVVLQFFNKRRNIKPIIESFRKTSVEEIIVIDDGSVDGSFLEWIKYLDRPNDFLLHCNDLYEVRTYDRAIRMARGEFVCLLQDDDLPSSSDSWVQDAITLFQNFPNLIMLGGREGVEIMIPDGLGLPTEPEHRYTEDVDEWTSIYKYKLYPSPLYKDPVSNIPFMFTMTCNRAPVFLRKKEFIEIGGINQDYAPYQCDDVDASIRAWLAGYQVGLYRCQFKRGLGRSGMLLYNGEKFGRYSTQHWKQVYENFYEVIANGCLQSLVNSSNQGLLIADCPSSEKLKQN